MRFTEWFISHDAGFISLSVAVSSQLTNLTGIGVAVSELAVGPKVYEIIQMLHVLEGQ